MSPEARAQVAQIIIRQLGGNAFIAMVGAKSIVATEIGGQAGVQFSIGCGANGGINKVRITLNEADLYDVEFFKIRGANIKEISKAKDVYAYQLAAVFTSHTDMATRL